MSHKSINRGLHLHHLEDFDAIHAKEHDFLVLGSVFCPLSRVDRDEYNTMDICNLLKSRAGQKKIFIQQPYYCKENGGQFITLVNKMRQMGLIDGVFVNSPGMVKQFTDDTELIISRFTIGKRKRVSTFFFDLLAGHNVVAMECFAEDTVLINEVRENSDIPLWIRESAGKLYTFSPNCLVEKYTGDCAREPIQCATGTYSLQSARHRAKFILSGHATYLEKREHSNLEFMTQTCDSVIFNMSGYEI